MDTATLVKAESEAVGAGIKKPNEARRRLNLAPVKGGDTPYLQQQNYSLAALDERDRNDPFAKPEPAPAAPAPGGTAPPPQIGQAGDGQSDPPPDQAAKSFAARLTERLLQVAA